MRWGKYKDINVGGTCVKSRERKMCQHYRMSGATLDRPRQHSAPNYQGEPTASINSPCLLHSGRDLRSGVGNRCCSTTDHFAVGPPRNDKGRRGPDQQGCRRRAEGEGPLAHSGGHLFSAILFVFSAVYLLLLRNSSQVDLTARPPKEMVAGSSKVERSAAAPCASGHDAYARNW